MYSKPRANLGFTKIFEKICGDGHEMSVSGHEMSTYMGEGID
jgi:hypothetical protein